MQTKDSPDFYLKHDFYGEYSDWGLPYAVSECNIATSDNIIINGHHMKDRTMFSNLVYYVWLGQKYYNSHRYIYFDTLDGGFGTYEIFAVLKISINDSFDFYGFTDAKNEAEFNSFVSSCKSRSRYDTGVTPVYGDKLITLVTCEGSREDLRVVVVAKKVA